VRYSYQDSEKVISMTDKEKEPNIFVPFSPKSLLLGALAEVGVRTAGEALGVPEGAGFAFGLAANATIETCKNAFAKARIVLNEQLNNVEANEFLPAKVRAEITGELVIAALDVLDANEPRIEAEISRMTRLAYKQASKNPFGTKAGVSLIHLA
jgi:hypothetical protein